MPPSMTPVPGLTARLCVAAAAVLVTLAAPRAAGAAGG
jgi:hypothetical protein